MRRLSATERHRITVTLNGRTVTAAAEPRMLLSDFLRETLGATGTHVGCEHGVCGACTVRVAGVAVRACLMLAQQADGLDIQTVEGLADSDGRLNALQKSFRRHHALQCGFCTPGILMTLTEFLERRRAPSEAEIRELLSGHLCRCTGYTTIIRAALDATAADDGENEGEETCLT